VARKDKTFSDLDIVRMWGRNLTLEEQEEVVKFFIGFDRPVQRQAFFPIAQAFAQIDVAQGLILAALSFLPVGTVFVALLQTLFDIRDTIERITEELERLRRGDLEKRELSDITQILLGLI